MAIVRQTWDQFQFKKDMGLFRGIKSLEIKFHFAFWRPLDAVGGKIYFGFYAEHDEDDEGFSGPGIPPGMGCSLAADESSSLDSHIPAGVSYSDDSDNFYLDMTHDGMGVAFYKRWKPRCREFPQRSTGLFPSEVISREMEREIPFSSMFGCSETEQLAKHVVQYLADNGDSWQSPVRVGVFDSLRDAYRLLNHVHSTGSCSPFLERYTSNGVVTQRFRDIVSRADMSFRDVLSAAEKRFVVDQDRLLQEEHSKDPRPLPQEPAWLTRLANAQGTHSISDFAAHEVAQYVRQLREASWPIIQDLECVGDNTDWRDKDNTDRVYSWFEIEPLKAAVLGNKRFSSPGLMPGVHGLGDGEMLAVD